AFLADPQLAEVVARDVEAGMRGEIEAQFLGRIDWHLGGFNTITSQDILFQTTGGATGNQGFFANVADTTRRGAELGLSGVVKRMSWFRNYTYLDATFGSTFRVLSPHHPRAIDFNGDGVPDGVIVHPGDRIPGLPPHNLKVSTDYAATSKLHVGAELLFNGNQYLRGDEANLLQPLNAYAVVGLRGEYRLSSHFTMFARIENLFDT